MLSQRWWRALSISGTAFTAAVLLGITKALNFEVDTNLFSTGITPGLIAGAWMAVLAIAIWKNKV